MSADTLDRKRWPFLKKTFPLSYRASLLAVVTHISNNSCGRAFESQVLPDLQGKNTAISLSLLKIPLAFIYSSVIFVYCGPGNLLSARVTKTSNTVLKNLFILKYK